MKIIFILKELLVGIFQFLKEIWFVWAFGLIINLSFWGFRKYKDLRARLNIAQLIDEAYIATAKREKLIEELATAQEALINSNEKIIDQSKQIENQAQQFNKQLVDKDKQLADKDQYNLFLKDQLKNQAKENAFLRDECIELKKLLKKDKNYENHFYSQRIACRYFLSILLQRHQVTCNEKCSKRMRK